ncbi:EAL and HDOD domain-containing protein [Peribacillus kribbensis]|uniref:EAL and HDOD domain-containing protein n=1 Tax=Peribacillus kribbensis TaxID=356658 RepID=UPI0003F4B118|nr:HDOD domain-containing protein [Peribacillus kribbensis]
MEVFVGRQPIFNENQELFGYELLSRNSEENSYTGTDGDKATVDVLAASFLSIGIDKLANGKKCFINFTKNLILEGLPALFQKDAIVIELLEDINDSKEILQACKMLKSLGYTIALDDYVFKDENKHLIDYADIIKVDFMNTNLSDISKLIAKVSNRNIVLLAEKVETHQEFLIAKEIGFKLFQGYFFSKPVVIKAKDVFAQVNYSYYALLEKLDSPEPDINEITHLIESDFSLAYKLLKIVNSTAYHMRNKISSIKQVIVILGLYEVRKWVLVLAYTSNKPKDKEVIRLSLCRAKFFESIGSIRGVNISEHFLFGLFSLIDTILDRPMSDILEELPLTLVIKEALQGKVNELQFLLDLVQNLERCRTDKAEKLSLELRIPIKKVYDIYIKSIEWSDNIVNTLD